jgi:hypothetical protein
MRRPVLLIALALAVATIVVYWPVMQNRFVSFDDGVYVAQNEIVQRGLTLEGLEYAFVGASRPYWQPITWLSHMLDCQLFGLRPGLHHLMSVIIHAANTVLLFLLLLWLTGRTWASAFVAAVFALHPLHVESVAWAAERKDLLSTLFWLLAMLAYARYARRPRVGAYLLTLVPLALGLMSKPMVVTLPCVLLLMDFWPLGRFRVAFLQATGEARAGTLAGAPASVLRLVLEKVPMLALAAAVSAVTVVMQHALGIMKNLDTLPVGARLAMAVVGYTRYIGKTVWPTNLAVFYDVPANADLWLNVGIVVLGALTGVAIWTRRTRPHLLVGWLWFLGTLVPVIGLVQVWEQTIADRFMYVPMIGLLVMVAWSVPAAWLERPWGRRAVGAVAAAALVACSVLTWRQIFVWRNTLTLFEHALACTVDNRVALNNVAWLYASHPDPAVRDGAEAVRLAERLNQLSDYGNVGHLDTLGVAYAEVRRFKQAMRAAGAAAAGARQVGAHEFADEVEERLKLYERSQPYRETNPLVTGVEPGIEPEPPPGS